MDKMFGTMVDCSRNAVMNVETVKKYARIIKKMGYNTLMLYTEETYEIKDQPYFGHLRGRYSADEIKEIDSFCASIGVELIPCIQTLAHLEHMFKWSKVYNEVNDCDNILLSGEEKTYELIEDMISTVSECFTSDKIHIGMDEAERVGLGKYLRLNGFRDRFDIINEHLHRVCEITEKYGLKPMIWSDMFCKLAMNTENQYDFTEEDARKILEKSNLPDNVSLVYWDYYEKDYDNYVRKIKANKIFGRNVYFAGGAITWFGFAPANQRSIESTSVAVKACKDFGIDGMLFTQWGDNGGECSAFAALPALMYAAEAAKGNTNIESIKAKFKEIVGCDYDGFMLFDELDRPDDTHKDNPSKYFLYNDLFMGIRDFKCKKGYGEYYRKLADRIRKVKDRGDFGEIFDFYEKLADTLAVKAELGIKTREAYLKRDTEKLKEIVSEYELFAECLKALHDAHQKRWFKENKPHGFDVQDLRLGGLMQRAESCKNRLIMLINGEISEIPELDEPMLSEINGDFNSWARYASVNGI